MTGFGLPRHDSVLLFLSGADTWSWRRACEGKIDLVLCFLDFFTSLLHRDEERYRQGSLDAREHWEAILESGVGERGVGSRHILSAGSALLEGVLGTWHTALLGAHLAHDSGMHNSAWEFGVY